jgi:hypothetical protein
MAHTLVDFEATCDDICTPASDIEALDENNVVSPTLIDISPDGKFFSRPVTEEIIRAYLENDFKV